MAAKIMPVPSSLFGQFARHYIVIELLVHSELIVCQNTFQDLFVNNERLHFIKCHHIDEITKNE